MSLEKKVKKGLLRRILSGTARTIGGIALLGSTIFVTNYFATHKDKVQVEETESGIEYSHPDKQTTHILNYIAGKEGLTEDEKAGACKFVDDTKNKFNPKKYHALWQIEMETNSPKIEWIDYREIFSLSSLSGYARYAPLSNTIYITCDSTWLSQDDLLSEFSHAKQYADNYVGSHLAGVESFIRTFRNMAIHDETFWPAYFREYSTWGSLEFEAHRVIEPQLRKKLK